MKPSPTTENLLYHKKKNKSMKQNRSLFLLFSLLCTTPLFTLFILLISTRSKITPKQALNQTTPISQPKNSTHVATQIMHSSSKKCDLFRGQWIRDTRGSSYSNGSCSTIPGPNNCFLYGREDQAFVNWRWKPDQCELPRFSPKAFFSLVRGKTLAFIGDSVTRNQVESLLCLLSQEENPINMYKDSDDHFRTWYYPSNDFTLKVLWSPWLVIGKERVANSGEFHLDLDKVEEIWSHQLPDMDYIIISGTHWFVRKLYLYNQGSLVGCMNCDDTNITHVGITYAFRLAFRTALKYITDCEDCTGLVTWVRTSSPSHFEQGSWEGGKCNRTSLLGLKEARELNLGGTALEFRKIQAKEVDRVRRKGEERGMKFEVFDITDAMLMRADGHPGIHWDNRYMSGYSDCIHWCLPGPVDVWNDLLLALLKNEEGS